MSIRKTKNHSGQVALMMVLLMTVISAVVISFAGRVTTETRIQNMMTNSTAAFLVAQSGIEDALQRGAAVANTLDDGGSYAVTVDEEGQEYVVTDSMVPGSTLEIVTEGGTGLTGARIYWQSLGATQSSLFVSVVSDSQIKDYAFDEEGENGFVKGSPSSSFQGVSFSHVTTELPLTASTKSIKISVLGALTKVGIEPIGGIFPSQVLKYRSNGSVGSGTTKTVYGLEYQESKNNKIPEVFDYAIFSNGAIIQ